MTPLTVGYFSYGEYTIFVNFTLNIPVSTTLNIKYLRNRISFEIFGSHDLKSEMINSSKCHLCNYNLYIDQLKDLRTDQIEKDHVPLFLLLVNPSLKLSYIMF